MFLSIAMETDDFCKKKKKQGHIPKKLNAASATKLLEMFEKLVDHIKTNSERAKISLLQSANIPFINNRIDKESKNQFLRERVIPFIQIYSINIPHSFKESETFFREIKETQILWMVNNSSELFI